MDLRRVTIPSKISEQTHFKGLKAMYEGKSASTKYIVMHSVIDKYIHIRIHRVDDEPICNWMDIQDIKNQLIGYRKAAIQVFPESDDMINKGNTYHIWAWDGIETPNLKELYDYSK